MRAAFAACTSLLVGLGLSACGASHKSAAAAASHTQSAGSGSGQLISFGLTTCAPNWRAHAAGSQHFRIENGSPRTATVYLFRSASGAIVATLSGVKAHSTTPLTVRLAAGSTYSWGCDLSGYPDHISDSETAPVNGQVAGPRVVPVYVADLVPALDSYRSYVRRTFTSLQSQLRSLLVATASGSLANARAKWLSAHLTWLALGQDDGAYGAFGNLGQQIDGTAAGLAGGASSPKFTGFHRVEADLWRKHNLKAATADTRILQRLVVRLAHQNLDFELPATKLGMTNFTIRCHEVLEDALRDSLSADDDYGSGTDLAAVVADVGVTRRFLGLLAPVISPRAPYLLAQARRNLDAVMRAVRATRHGGSWIPISSLPHSQRLQVDAAVGGALNTLSRVPDLLAIGGS